jgi:hypothetical protein
MPESRALVFWMGGILTESILDTTTKAMSELGCENANLLALPGYREITDKFILGKIEGKDYFKVLVEGTGVGLDPQTLEKKTRQLLLPDERALSVIDLLPEGKARWLLCEFPPDWIDGTPAQDAIEKRFNSGMILYLSKIALEIILPDLWDVLPGMVGELREHILYFDQNSKRVVSAINHGYPTAVYVDPRRLQREFVIRGFISGSIPLHTPPVNA